jgi:hypothetical protein
MLILLGLSTDVASIPASAVAAAFGPFLSVGGIVAVFLMLSERFDDPGYSRFLCDPDLPCGPWPWPGPHRSCRV